MIKIIPAVLTNSPSEAAELLGKAEGVMERAQVDIVDGVFTNNKTIDPSSIEEVETSLKLDFHLMVKEPVNWVEKSVRAGGDRIIGQVELMSNQVEFVGKVQESGSLVGLALDIDTPVSAIDESIIKDLDVILLMSVKAGFGGQTFDLSVWDKIKELVDKKKAMNAEFQICVDGGVTHELVKDMAKEGVNEVVVGRRIFEGSLEENLKKF